MVRVRAHPRRGTRGVRKHVRWVLPADESRAVEWIPTDEAYDVSGWRGHLLTPYDQSSIAYHANLLRRRQPVEPIQVFRAEGVRPPRISTVEEGFHRTLAAKRVGLKQIPVVVYT